MVAGELELGAAAVKDLLPEAKVGARLLEEILTAVRGDEISNGAKALQTFVTEDSFGLQALHKLQSATSMHLADATDQELGLLSKCTMPHLETLTLSGRGFTETGLHSITRQSFPNLSTVGFSGTGLNPSISARFAARLPEVRIESSELVNGSLFPVTKLQPGPEYSPIRTYIPKGGYKPSLTEIEEGWGRYSRS